LQTLGKIREDYRQWTRPLSANCTLEPVEIVPQIPNSTENTPPIHLYYGREQRVQGSKQEPILSLSGSVVHLLIKIEYSVVFPTFCVHAFAGSNKQKRKELADFLRTDSFPELIHIAFAGFLSTIHTDFL
jgi:hypothetical protein